MDAKMRIDTGYIDRLGVSHSSASHKQNKETRD